MNNKASYQKRLGSVLIVEGEGNPSHLNAEAEFLAYYGHKLAERLKEDELKLVVASDGRQLNAFGFPEGATEGSDKICGVFPDSGPSVDLAVKELNCV